jgi:peptidyl-prolyl cis-trans isomerase C
VRNLSCILSLVLIFYIVSFMSRKYGAPPDAIKATARHILVKTSEDASMVLDKLSSDASSFADLAKEYSTCPSGSSGGSLGSFEPGTMVPEFDKVIFSPETVLGTILGPVETKFGYHLIVVDKRSGGGDWY